VARRRMHAGHMRRRIHADLVRFLHDEEENTCMSYVEEDTCRSSAILAWRGLSPDSDQRLAGWYACILLLI
jgi:hypothetical protein